MPGAPGSATAPATAFFASFRRRQLCCRTPRRFAQFQSSRSCPSAGGHPETIKCHSERSEKSLSDISGTDVYIHDGNARGVFTQLCNAFVRLESQPATENMEKVYRRLTDLLPELQKQAGASSPFEARVFRDLVVAARALTRHQKDMEE